MRWTATARAAASSGMPARRRYVMARAVQRLDQHRATAARRASSSVTPSRVSCWPANDRSGRSSAVADERTATARRRAAGMRRAPPARRVRQQGGDGRFGERGANARRGSVNRGRVVGIRAGQGLVDQVPQSVRLDRRVEGVSRDGEAGWHREAGASQTGQVDGLAPDLVQRRRLVERSHPRHRHHLERLISTHDELTHTLPLGRLDDTRAATTGRCERRGGCPQGPAEPTGSAHSGRIEGTTCTSSGQDWPHVVARRDRRPGRAPERGRDPPAAAGRRGERRSAPVGLGPPLADAASSGWSSSSPACRSWSSDSWRPSCSPAPTRGSQGRRRWRSMGCLDASCLHRSRSSCHHIGHLGASDGVRVSRSYLLDEADRRARAAQTLLSSPGAGGRRGRLCRPGCCSRTHHRRGAATTGPPRRCCPVGRGSKQPRPSPAPPSPRGGGYRGVVSTGGRPPEAGQRQQPAPAALGQPGPPRPGRPTSDHARPVDRRRRPRGQGPLPRVPQRRARLGGHRRGRRGPPCRRNRGRRRDAGLDRHGTGAGPGPDRRRIPTGRRAHRDRMG